MRKFLLATAVLAMGWSQASAGVVFDQFIAGNVLHTMKDNSVSNVFNKEGGDADVIEVGDIIQGIIRLDQRIEPDPDVTADDTDQLVIVYAAKIAAPTGIFFPSFGNNFDLVALDPTDAFEAGFILKTMLPNQLSAYSATDLADGIFALLDGTSATNPTGTDLATALGLIDTLAVYDLDIVGGIVEDDDFMKSTIGSTSLPLIKGLTGGSEVGLVRGGFTTIVNVSGHTFTDDTPISRFDTTTSEHEFVFNGTLLAPTDTQQNDNGYDIGDSTIVSFTPNAVPEPSSLILFGAGFAGLLGFSRRRKSLNA